MKSVDRLLQNWRFAKGRRYLLPGVRLIDVGAHHGELFRALGSSLREGYGIEPLLQVLVEAPTYAIVPGYFPSVCPKEGEWDAITMLAVLEHIPRADQTALSERCYELLKTGGRVIITVPSRMVDYILAILRFFRVIDGMSLEEHFGFKPAETERIFSRPWFKLVSHEHFQFGLNHLYVFEKEPDPEGRVPR